MKNWLKVIAGILLMAMGMLVFANSILAYPAAMTWSATRVEWWAFYLPLLLLVNSLIAVGLCMYLGVGLITRGLVFTEKQTRKEGKAQ